jgi:hypothetical protein
MLRNCRLGDVEGFLRSHIGWELNIRLILMKKNTSHLAEKFKELVTGLSGEKFLGEEEAQIPIGRDISLILRLEEDHSIGLYSTIHEVRGGDIDAILTDIAYANFGCIGTIGATLGYHPPSGKIMLSRLLPYAERAEAIDLIVLGRTFISTALRWQERLAGLQGGGVSRHTQTDQPDFSLGAFGTRA